MVPVRPNSSAQKYTVASFPRCQTANLKSTTGMTNTRNGFIDPKRRAITAGLEKYCRKTLLHHSLNLHVTN